MSTHAKQRLTEGQDHNYLHNNSYGTSMRLDWLVGEMGWGWDSSEAGQGPHCCACLRHVNSQRVSPLSRRETTPTRTGSSRSRGWFGRFRWFRNDSLGEPTSNRECDNARTKNSTGTMLDSAVCASRGITTRSRTTIPQTNPIGPQDLTGPSRLCNDDARKRKQWELLLYIDPREQTGNGSGPSCSPRSTVY